MAILDNLKGLFSLEVEGFLENPFKLVNYTQKCAIRACEHKKLVLSQISICEATVLGPLVTLGQLGHGKDITILQGIRKSGTKIKNKSLFGLQLRVILCLDRYICGGKMKNSHP